MKHNLLGNDISVKPLVSLFIGALDLGFLKPLRRVTQFLVFCRARIIHDTNVKPVMPTLTI
jgi:hypothetical protein